MTTKEKTDKLTSFKDEKEFREFLIDFLKKSNFKDVIHTHRYGSPEQGKDIIANIEHPVIGKDWFAFVVKKGRISGGTNEIETIKNQVIQSFEYPYKGIDGNKIKVNKVVVVTNENFTGGAQSQISSSDRLRLYSNNISYWWNENLIPLIDKNYSDFWLPGDAFAKEFYRNFTSEIEKEISIRELSIRKVDDKKIQKLLDIFIEPKLTYEKLEENKKTNEKQFKTKSLEVNNIRIVDENILLTGDQGVGKTKILNKIACNLANPISIFKNKQIPVRLKAIDLRNSDFNIEFEIERFLKKYANQFYNEEIYNNYKVILLIDDYDLLRANEKKILLANLNNYCDTNNTYFVLTYRKNELNIEDDVKTIKIHNFSTRQIESFVNKFFEGTDRAEKFIRILKESDILSKLPTTPLTISLISLLYDENNFEIPATLSDIYSDFTNVLLGKLEVYSKSELIIYNIKKRLFTAFALHMLENRTFDIPFNDFKNFINKFLRDRDYEEQSRDEVFEIIEKSGLLYITDNNIVGFKQQAFIEFLASLEIYHHKRDTHYKKLINGFNDVTWQNTAIFYAGHSKELEGMIDDVIEKSPNDNLIDWFVNSSGMGYLAQALYQTKALERKKLVFKSLDNMIKSYYEMKRMTGDDKTIFYNLPLPLVLGTINHWFNENFKSITLKNTLNISFNELFSSDNNFENNYKLLMISSTLMTPYINDDEKFGLLLERKEFMNHPILPLVADLAIELGIIEKKNVNKELKKKIELRIKRKRELIKSLLKEPAYRFSDKFSLEK